MRGLVTGGAAAGGTVRIGAVVASVCDVGAFGRATVTELVQALASDTRAKNVMAGGPRRTG